jgi:hypothetical protein
VLAILTKPKAFTVSPLSPNTLRILVLNASNIAALEKTGAGNRARVDGGGGVEV